MIALTSSQWVLVALMAACYVAICLHMALRMARTGRSLWKWLLVTFFLTGIPAAIVLFRDQAARSSRRPAGGAGGRQGELLRCPHCGKRVRREDVDNSGGVAACPGCGLPMDQANRG